MAEFDAGPAEKDRLSMLGVRSDMLDDEDVRKRFPAMNPCRLALDVETGAEHECGDGGKHLLEVDGGYVDPVDALHDMLDALSAWEWPLDHRSSLLARPAEIPKCLAPGGAAQHFRG